MNEIEKAIERYRKCVEFISKDLQLQDDELYRMDKPTRDEMEIARNDHLLAIQALEEKLNNRWIPVSERLPNEDGYYLVSCNGGDVHTDFFWCDNGNGNSHNNTWLNRYLYDIIAWKPLPESYQPVEEE